MERAMLGVSLRDQIRNEEIRRRTKADIAQRVMKLKRKWAAHRLKIGSCGMITDINSMKMVLKVKCYCLVISLTMVLAMDPLLKDLLTPLPQLGEKCSYESCPALKDGWINVHLVPHSHGELGLSKTFVDYYSGDSFGGGMKIRVNWKNIFDSTISELWAVKDRKFTVSDSELPFFFHWWARRDGMVRRMVYELVRQGRLMFIGGGWGMHDEASTSYQAVIDSYTYSMRKINATFLSCGRPTVAWQADVLGHSREYASLVAQMGFDGLFVNPISFDDELPRMGRRALEFVWRGSDDLGFIKHSATVAWQADALGHSREYASLVEQMDFDGQFISPISFDDELLRMGRRALEFVWRGSDDLGAESDVYTHKLFDGYWSPPGFCFGSMCSDPLLMVSDSVFRNVDGRIDEFISQIRYRQSPNYNTRQLMVMMGQRFGYFDAKIWFNNVDTLIQKFNERTYKNNEKMHATYSTPACFLKAVYEDNPILETKQDDFFPYAYKKNTYTTGMYTTRPTFKYLVRESNIFLQMAKQLHVSMNLGNYDKMFENFNWIMGVVQDHNVISGAMRDHVASYYVDKLHSAVQWATELFQDAFNKIRKSPPNTEYRLCFLNTSSCPNTKLDRFHVTIYNPLAWPVTMPVRLPIRNVKYTVFDPSGRKIKAIKMPIPEHVFDIPNRKVPVTYELVFIAENLPPMGLKGYFIQREIKVRLKRSIIKKKSKNQQKKYYIRQTPKENRTYIEMTREYDDDTKLGPKIEFGSADYDEITPKYRSDVESIIKDTDDTRIFNFYNESPVDDQYEMASHNNESVMKNDDEFDSNNAELSGPRFVEQRSDINNQSTLGSSIENNDEFENVTYISESNKKTFDENDPNIKDSGKFDNTPINNVSSNTAIEEIEPTIKSHDETEISYADNELNNTNVGDNETTNVDNESNSTALDKIKNPVNYNEVTNQNVMSDLDNESNNTNFDEIHKHVISDEPISQNINESQITNLDIEITTTENIEVLDTEKTTKEYPAEMHLLNVTKFRTLVHEVDKEKLRNTISSDLNKDNYYAIESNDNFIRNQYIQINIDEFRKITSMNLSNGENTSLDIQYYYYISDVPTDNSTRQPGAYIFRSVGTKPEPIIDFIETKVYKSDIVEEIHTRYSKYASFSVKLYINNPMIEIDWVIGPVPVEDNAGKEVFLRYTTDLENEGVFYTDANGRQTVKRIRHMRPMYEPYDLDPIAGNFYPVTSRIYIEDPKKNLRFSIFNDRSQGGSSLLEGSIDLMVHRRILTDTSGSFIIINETEYGKGLIVRGNHYLYLTKADYKQNRVYEKKIAKEIELKPQIMFNRIIQDLTKDDWLNYNNEFTSLNKKLPVGVHVLTLQEWNDKTILLRLENYLEKVDAVKSGVKRVDIKNLFHINILSLKEMTLAANMLLKDNIKLNWRVNGSFVRNFNDFYGSSSNIDYSSDELKVAEDVNLNDDITLVPQQIRTFVVKYEYNKY